jgi:hypothetical protein
MLCPNEFCLGPGESHRESPSQGQIQLSWPGVASGWYGKWLLVFVSLPFTAQAAQIVSSNPMLELVRYVMQECDILCLFTLDMLYLFDFVYEIHFTLSDELYW